MSDASVALGGMARGRALPKNSKSARVAFRNRNANIGFCRLDESNK